MTEVKGLFLVEDREIPVSCCHWDVSFGFTFVSWGDDYMILVLERLLI